MIKQRLTKIENQIAKKREASKIRRKMKTKIWPIRVREGKKSAEKQEQEIRSGEVKHKDGSYYSDNDFNIFVISAISDRLMD